MKALALDPARAAIVARYADRSFAGKRQSRTDRRPQTGTVQQLV